MFDETTTEQKIKQMDILVRDWDEEKHLLVNKASWNKNVHQPLG